AAVAAAVSIARRAVEGGFMNMRYLALAARQLLAVTFIIASAGHFTPDTIASAAHHGVPLASLLVPIAGLIVVFLVPVTLMMHNFWSAADAATFQRELMLFARNLGLLAGALQVGHSGAGALSLGALMADSLVAEPVAELDYVA